MLDGIFVFGTISGIDFIYVEAIYMAKNATNWPFKLIFYVFMYKCYPMKMLNIAFQMRYVRQVSGIVSGIDLIFSGAIYRTRNAKNNHLCQFLMYLSTNGTWWKYQISHSECEMSDRFPALNSFMPGQFTGPEMQKTDHLCWFNRNIVQKSARELMHSVKWYGLICLKKHRNWWIQSEVIIMHFK